jgi:hypothetical protein
MPTGIERPRKMAFPSEAEFKKVRKLRGILRCEQLQQYSLYLPAKSDSLQSERRADPKKPHKSNTYTGTFYPRKAPCSRE